MHALDDIDLDTTASLDTTDRVRAHTAPLVNARIDDVTEEAVTDATAGGVMAIGRRLGHLDKEWDVDRALMATFSVLGGTSFLLSERFAHRKPGRFFRWLLRAQFAFLMVHAVVGWCPPASALRRLGFRTQREIERERRELLRNAEVDRAMRRQPRSPQRAEPHSQGFDDVTAEIP
jgi:hypothetical protein